MLTNSCKARRVGFGSRDYDGDLAAGRCLIQGAHFGHLNPFALFRLANTNQSGYLGFAEPISPQALKCDSKYHIRVTNVKKQTKETLRNGVAIQKKRTCCDAESFLRQSVRDENGPAPGVTAAQFVKYLVYLRQRMYRRQAA